MRRDIAISENLGDLELISRPPSFTVDAVWDTETNDNVRATIELPPSITQNNLNNGIGVRFPRMDSTKNVIVRFLFNLPNGSQSITEYKSLKGSSNNNITGIGIALINDNFFLRISGNEDDDFVTCYSGYNTDLIVMNSIDQNEFLLLVSNKGNVLESPLLGVGAYNYVHSNIQDSDLAANIRENFALDGLNVRRIDLNTLTNEIFIESEEI